MREEINVQVFDRDNEVLLDLGEHEARPGDAFVLSSRSAHTLTVFFGEPDDKTPAGMSYGPYAPGETIPDLPIPFDANGRPAGALYVVTEDDQWPKILIRRPRTSGAE